MLSWIARLLGAAPPTKAKPAAATPPRQPHPKPHALRVRLPLDRRLEGTAEVLDADGAVMASGWAIGAVWRDLAKAAGNPDADPLLPFGDVPSGRYALARAATDAELGDVPPGEDVGAIRPVLFAATDGAGLRAQAAGRLRLAVHAGRRGPACGALRVEEGVMALVARLPEGAVLAVEDAAAPAQARSAAAPARAAAAGTSQARASHPTGSAASRVDPRRDDPMDGFLFAYLTGIPLNLNPGSILGMVLHNQNSGARAADLAAQKGLSDLGLAPARPAPVEPIPPAAKPEAPAADGGKSAFGAPAQDGFATGGTIEGGGFRTGGTLEDPVDAPKDTGGLKPDWSDAPAKDVPAEPVSLAAPAAAEDSKSAWGGTTSSSGPDLDSHGGYGR